MKLRLRGKGSGFKEGPRQEESNEPLHLCISSRYFDKYQTACNHVQELIMNVYEEYKRFCEKNKKEPKPDLQVKKIETVTGRRSMQMPPPNQFTPNVGGGSGTTQPVSQISSQMGQVSASAQPFIPSQSASQRQS